MPELRSDWANNQLLLLAAIKDFKDKLASGEYSANQRFHVSLDFKCEFSTLRERDDYIAALGKLKQFNFTDELGRPDPLPKVDITFTADDPVDPAVGRFYLASSRFPIDSVVANFDPATIPF